MHQYIAKPASQMDTRAQKFQILYTYGHWTDMPWIDTTPKQRGYKNRTSNLLRQYHCPVYNNQHCYTALYKSRNLYYGRIV